MISRDGVELADIIREFGAPYIRTKKLPLHFLKVMNAIEKCRTSYLGGHVDECDSCGYVKISYNSCRNRHCPKCQSLAKEEWLIKRKQELLAVTYFHVVFTIPDLLNPLVLVNQKIMYGILFKAVAETLISLGKDRKHLGADIGLIAILHTWGQNLSDHPHLHCVVPGGGLSEDGSKWIYPKKSKKNKKFFIHVNIISDLFKKKFLFYLKRSYQNGLLKFEGRIKSLAEKKDFKNLLDQLYTKRWVSYCKRPFGGPEQVLEYLGRYTHRVAISNNRIQRIENGRVFFTWKDYLDKDKVKETSLEVFEFIRRFLQHVLPQEFFKIRYYGILSSRNKKNKLEKCRQILGNSNNREESEKIDWRQLILKITGIDPAVCPKCKNGLLRRVEELIPVQIAAAPT
jgi:predicted Zn-ribbon and HTH transcriptional regulator